LLGLVLLFATVLVAGLFARFGTTLARFGGGALLAVGALLVVARSIRDARTYAEPRRALARVLFPVDRPLAERALRAARLAERVEWDASLGSRELAALHFERLLAKASVDAIQAAGVRRARWLRRAAFAVLLLAGLLVARDPHRVLEGLDVMVARGGRAPIAMSWLELVRVTVQPPAYLHRGERSVISLLDSEEPQGSLIVVRGMPTLEGRRLVLTDGESEVPFVDDGTGGVIARYTLNHHASLAIGARFGKVLIPEAERLELDAVPDAAPVIELEGAPRRVALSHLDRLELRYEITDDHGLRDVDLVLRSGKREERRSLAHLDGETRLERGAYALDASDHFLRSTFLPVEVGIEARDNEALKPTKWGKSALITLTPTDLGALEASRYEAIRGARTALAELLASELNPTESKALQRQAESEGTRAAAVKLRDALDTHWRLSAGLSAFLGGQARVLERPLATPASAVKRTEDVLLGVDAALRGLGNRDAATVAKRLGDAAEEAADGAHQALATEQRDAGVHRLHEALAVLDAGAKNLLTLSALGRDLGSVSQGEIRRIRRADSAGSLSATELVARHLAARLRRPDASFSAAGSGSVESGSHGKSAQDEPPSDADRKFDELVGELERLASEHQTELERVERDLDDAEKSVDLQSLKDEAMARARALRDKAGELPQFSADANSASASAALAREHAESMAQNLSRLALREAVDSGLRAKAELADANKRAKNPERAADYIDPEALSGAQSELERALGFAQEALAKAQQQAAEKAAPSLQESSSHERSFAERAGNLAGRGNHGEIALPQELADSLEKAEGMMREASRELGAGRGSQGLSLQRDAQRLLEQSNSGKSDSEGDESKDAHPEHSAQPHGSGQNGKSMRTDADVPRPDSSKQADDFRRRVLGGLGRDSGGRLAGAVRRYAEGLLK
jgi:hypothetical protein